MDAYSNFPVSTVATAPSPATSGTSLQVQTGHGTRFPATPFNAIVCPVDEEADSSNAEIVRVTNKSGVTFTITRAEESSTARAIQIGDRIYQAVTKKTLDDLVPADDPALTDERTPPDGSVTNQKVAAGAAIEKSKLAPLAIINADIDAAAAIAKSKLAALNIGDADVAAGAGIARSKLGALAIVNADIDAAAAIARTKLGALNIVNADVAAGAAIAKSKLGALGIVNADVDAAAAIAKSKLGALAIVNSDIDAAAAIAKTKLASLAIVNADVASGAAIAKSKLAPLAIVNSDIDAAASIAKSKLAALNVGNSDVAAGAAIDQSKIASLTTDLVRLPSTGQKDALDDLDARGKVLVGSGSGAVVLDAGEWLIVPKTADETVNNSTALQNDDELFLALAANETWQWELQLLLTAAGGIAPDWKFAFTVPAGATLYWGEDEWSSGTRSALRTAVTTQTEDSIASAHGLRFRGTVLNGGTAGNLQFRWAQNTANASDSKVLKGSILRGQLVATA